MTLARKIYLLMTPGVNYTIDELEDLLLEAAAAYNKKVVDREITIEEAVNEEWLAAAEGGDVPAKIRAALKITRGHGYTAVNVETIPAHDRVVHRVKYGKFGTRREIEETLHYDEFKKFTYQRIK